MNNTLDGLITVNFHCLVSENINKTEGTGGGGGLIVYTILWNRCSQKFNLFEHLISLNIVFTCLFYNCLCSINEKKKVLQVFVSLQKWQVFLALDNWSHFTFYAFSLWSISFAIYSVCNWINACCVITNWHIFLLRCKYSCFIMIFLFIFVNDLWMSSSN